MHKPRNAFFANRLALASRTPRDLGTCKLEKKLSKRIGGMSALMSCALSFVASQLSLGTLTRRPEGKS
jgi:hypothetical protein